MSFAGKFAKVNIITLSKISQAQKHKHHILSLIYCSYIEKKGHAYERGTI
jgi:hypothetical protein